MPVWAFYVLAVAIFAGILAVLGVVAESVWERATQAPRVFALIWGIYQTALYLPLYIAHGLTRRAFALQRALLVPPYVLCFAVLMAIPYVLEYFVYAALGWPHGFTMEAVLFDTPLQVPLIVLHYCLILAAWISAGALLGAAFYRWRWLALPSIPIATTLVGSVESLLHDDRALPRVFYISDLSQPLANLDPGPVLSVMMGAVIFVSSIAAVLLLTWLVIRDMPVRASNA